jgi:uncharacterized protein (UPF0261 family)
VSFFCLAGTADTKYSELAYLLGKLDSGPLPVKLLDLSTTGHTHPVDITAIEIADHHPGSNNKILGGKDRGPAVLAMGEAFAEFCKRNSRNIAAIIGIGGGGGTAMVTAGMRELPYGIPKVMVSTLASGDTAPYVGTSDIIMIPSVTDIAGLNSLSRLILHNAANALLGMIGSKPPENSDDKPAIGLTMFGVTTPAVTEIVRQIGERFDSLVFHATGTGGRTMEKLLLERRLQGLIDLTTTEIADLLCDGVLSAGPGRLDAIAATRAPYVGAPGALDMVNFWAPPTVPSRYRDRLFYNHNANVTLMRTNNDECRRIGTWIADKLNRCDGPVRFLIPEKGFSALDIEGGAFQDTEADAALVDALASALKITADRQLIRLPLHINDPEFARSAFDQFLKISEL